MDENVETFNSETELSEEKDGSSITLSTDSENE
jgi:hypothetical protein